MWPFKKKLKVTETNIQEQVVKELSIPKYRVDSRTKELQLFEFITKIYTNTEVFEISKTDEIIVSTYKGDLTTGFTGAIYGTPNDNIVTLKQWRYVDNYGSIHDSYGGFKTFTINNVTINIPISEVKKITNERRECEVVTVTSENLVEI